MLEIQNPFARSIKTDEIHTAALVAQIAFNSEKTRPWEAPAEWLAKNKGTDYVIVAEADGKIVSSLISAPSLAIFGTDNISLASVGSVATLPEYRRRGCAAAMMEHVVKTLYEHGQILSALWPFSFAYYRKFGWELGSETRTYHIPIEIASSIGNSNETRPALATDIPAISNLSNRLAEHYNCISRRDSEWWDLQQVIREFKLDEKDDIPNEEPVIWVHEKGGEIEGYCVFELSKDENGEPAVKVYELTAETKCTRNSLIARMAMADTKAQKIIFDAPADDTLLAEIENPRSVECKVSPGFQFRVINPKAAIESLSIDPNIQGKLTFEISDPVLGKISFTAEAENGRIITSRNKRDGISMSIQTFSQIFSGYLRPIKAAHIGKVEPSFGTDIEFLESLIPKRLPYRSNLELG